MIQYIAVYAGGIATGVGLLLGHQYSVKRAVSKEKAQAKRDMERLRNENCQLREDLQAFELSSEAARAREQGKIVGLREGRNQSNYQRFEQALNGGGRRSVQVGGGLK